MVESDQEMDALTTQTNDIKPVEEEDSSIPEGRHRAGDVDFEPWHEGPLPSRMFAGIGHRHIIKKDVIREGIPVKITHEISFEAEPEHEGSIEVIPAREGDAIVGLQITCTCGASHEIRFEYTEE